jgi:hypothetical protein
MIGTISRISEGVEAGQHLVQQQQPRLDRQRARQLEPLAAGNRQRCGRPVEQVAQSHRARNIAGGGKGIGPRRPGQMRADRDVLPHAQGRERLHDLECAGDAAPRQPMRGLAGDIDAIVDDAARARRRKARNDREQRGLAGAIRSDQRGDASGLRQERCPIEGEQAAEALRYLLDTQQRLNHGRRPTMQVPPA